MKTLLLAGFYGRGNSGDEAILQCVAGVFESQYRLTILVDEHGAYPGFWDWYPYNKARIIHRTNIAYISQNHDIAGLIVGGGGLPMGFVAHQVLIANALGIPAVLAGVDLWPTEISGRTVNPAPFGKYLDLFDLIAIRHRPNSALPGVEGRDIAYGADWALNLPTDDAPEVTVERKRAIIVIREYPIDNIAADYRSMVLDYIALVSAHGYEPVLLPSAPEDERWIETFRLEPIKVERTWWNPRRMKQIIDSSGMLLSFGRLHPLIFAATTDVPVAAVSLPYLIKPLPPENKVTLMCREFGIREIEDKETFVEFLKHPKPANRAAVVGAVARLGTVIERIKTLIA